MGGVHCLSIVQIVSSKVSVTQKEVSRHLLIPAEFTDSLKADLKHECVS